MQVLQGLGWTFLGIASVASFGVVAGLVRRAW
jgi:hypothetical protein